MNEIIIAVVTGILGTIGAWITASRNSLSSNEGVYANNVRVMFKRIDELTEQRNKIQEELVIVREENNRLVKKNNSLIKTTEILKNKLRKYEA